MRTLDECTTEESNPCGLGECINESGGYQCLCPKGYQFEQSVCKDINECEQDKTSSPCGSHGDCINLEGGFNCSCHPGFTKGCLSLFNYFVDMSNTLMSSFFVKKNTCF